MKFQVPSDNRRACLCRDGSYSTKCCNQDDYFAQGIGSIYQGETDSAGTITEIDTQETISSTSTTPISQGTSTVIETDTTQTYTSTSSESDQADEGNGGNGITRTITSNLTDYLKIDQGHTVAAQVTVFGDNEPNAGFQDDWGFTNDTYMGLYTTGIIDFTQAVAKDIVTWFTNETSPSINTEYDLAVTFGLVVTEEGLIYNAGYEVGESYDPSNDVTSTIGIKVKYTLSPNGKYSAQILDPDNNLTPTTQGTYGNMDRIAVSEI